MTTELYIFLAAFTVISGLAGGAIGFYKSKSEFQANLKEYRSAADCANCVTRSRVDTMEQDFKDMISDFKEHTSAMGKLFTEVALINQKQEEILRKIKELKKEGSFTSK